MNLKPLLALLFLAFVAPIFAADDTALVAALTKADDERIAAIQAGDRTRLEAIFSDELRYSHSSGKVDTKASYVASLTSKATTYHGFEYKERSFKKVGPGVAIMSGRVITSTSSNGGKPNELDLNFLAVWREESGKWKFFAWQSCKNTPAPAAATK